MQQIIDDIRTAITARIGKAAPRDVLAMASRLCDDEQPRIALPPSGPRILRPDFEIVDNDVVLDRSTGLFWLRDHVSAGERDWQRSKDAAETCKVRGWTWRMPEIWERLSIVDYSRHNPALNTEIFRGEAGWEWTATNYTPIEGCAWSVYFYYGSACGHGRNDGGFVRAVRGGQY